MKSFCLTIIYIFAGVAALVAVMSLLALGRLLRSALKDTDWYENNNK